MLQRLDQLSKLEPLNENSIDPAIRAHYVGKGGQFRVEVVPAADADTEEFARAVLSVAPAAMGSAITHLREVASLHRAVISASLFVLAAQIFIAGIILRNLTRALCVTFATIAIMALLGGTLWLTGKPLAPLSSAALLLMPALAISCTISMAMMRARAL